MPGATRDSFEQAFRESFRASVRVKGCRKQNSTLCCQSLPSFILKNYSPIFFCFGKRISNVISFIPLELFFDGCKQKSSTTLFKILFPIETVCAISDASVEAETAICSVILFTTLAGEEPHWLEF
ncbi:hypothetical protein TNCV_1424021 [Trichonephila clavipes]|nr:hypothetical protein TNCV_1424021 [Trichonephila clavipes]